MARSRATEAKQRTASRGLGEIPSWQWVTILSPLVHCFSFPKGFWGIAMEKPAQNIQDSFLNNARKDKVVLTIYLMSGVKLSGRIKSFDKYSLVLETNNQEQLIFKHAISTVVTQKTAHSYGGGPAGRRAGGSAASRAGSAGAYRPPEA